jgi:hypothetical protein
LGGRAARTSDPQPRSALDPELKVDR